MSNEWPPPPDPLPEPQPPRPEDHPSALDGSRLTVLGPDGRYELDGVLATGGQSVVWRARDRFQGRDVVVKTTKENAGTAARILSRRLERETRMLHLFRDHPDVMPLLDHGPGGFDGQDVPGPGAGDRAMTAAYSWLVLPERPHRGIERLLADEGPLGVDVGRIVGLQLATALRRLHDCGAVHRDVSPGNVFLTPEGVLLADFGMAWSPTWTDEADDEYLMSTGLTTAVGRHRTPGWAPPEFRSPLDAGGRDPAAADRSPTLDVFGWGLYVAVIVTGRHPWARPVGDRTSVRLDGWELDRFVDGSEFYSDVVDEIPDRVLSALIRAALEPNPDNRPTASQIVESLETGDLPGVVAGGRRSRRGAGATTSGGDEPLERLAHAVRTQWRNEAEIRRLNDPYPLPVAWDPAPEELVDSWETVERVARSGAGGRARWPRRRESDIRGADAELADVVARRIPTRRLVVLGRPGAGKTMLLVRLVLDLLAARGDIDGRVPVLVSLASWDPDAEGLRDWLRRSLLVDHPWLRDRTGERGIGLVDRLLDEHRILPVLDGLDEIPDPGRPSAVEKINDWLAGSPEHQLVISCRLDEYARMVAPAERVAGATLRAGAGVVLRELADTDIVDYLTTDARASGALRWEPVFQVLGTGAPVDLALRTPLMVGLARVVYNPRGGEPLPEAEPEELCRLDRFPDRAAVERHLFDAFVPASYREHPDPARRCRWSPAQSERWLRNLAQHLGDPSTATTLDGPVRRAPLGTTDLAWWQLHASVSPWLVGGLAAVLPGTAVGLAAAFGPRLGMGLGVGLLIGVIVAAVLRRWPGPAVVAPVTKRWAGGPVAGIAVGAASAVLGAMVGGAVGGLVGLGNGWAGGLVGAIGVGLGVGPVGGLAACVVGGLAGGVAVGLTAGVGPGLPAGVLCGLGAGVASAVILVFAGRDKPARGLGGYRLLWLPGIGAGLVAGVGLGLTAGPAAGIAGALAGFCLGLLNPEADLRSASGPRMSLVRDRRAFIALGLVPGVLVTTGASLAVLPIVGIAGGITVGLVFGSLQAAWGRYLLARMLLAVSGRLPWRLMHFLADAHRERGVLRQVGAVYQFRHADLQRRLAERP